MGEDPTREADPRAVTDMAELVNERKLAAPLAALIAELNRMAARACFTQVDVARRWAEISQAADQKLPPYAKVVDRESGKPVLVVDSAKARRWVSAKMSPRDRVTPPDADLRDTYIELYCERSGFPAAAVWATVFPLYTAAIEHAEGVNSTRRTPAAQAQDRLQARVVKLEGQAGELRQQLAREQQQSAELAGRLARVSEEQSIQLGRRDDQHEQLRTAIATRDDEIVQLRQRLEQAERRALAARADADKRIAGQRALSDPQQVSQSFDRLVEDLEHPDVAEVASVVGVRSTDITDNRSPKAPARNEPSPMSDADTADNAPAEAAPDAAITASGDAGRRPAISSASPRPAARWAPFAVLVSMVVVVVAFGLVVVAFFAEPSSNLIYRAGDKPKSVTHSEPFCSGSYATCGSSTVLDAYEWTIGPTGPTTPGSPDASTSFVLPEGETLDYLIGDLHYQTECASGVTWTIQFDGSTVLSGTLDTLHRNASMKTKLSGRRPIVTLSLNRVRDLPCQLTIRWNNPREWSPPPLRPNATDM